jgi:hypothetical protein
MKGEVPECLRSLLTMLTVDALGKSIAEQGGALEDTKKEFGTYIDYVKHFAAECELTDDVPKAPLDVQTNLSKLVQKWSRIDSYRDADGEPHGLTPEMKSLITSMVTDIVETHERAT